MYCLHCNKIIESQQFCPECGRLLVDKNFSLENRDIEMEIQECNNLEKEAQKNNWKRAFWWIGLLLTCVISIIVTQAYKVGIDYMVSFVGVPIAYLLISLLFKGLAVELCKDPEKRKKEKEEYWQKELDKERAKQEARALEQALHPVVCPACGSTHVHKIGAFSRAFSVQLLGLHSNVINKTFECENCGYTW